MSSGAARFVPETDISDPEFLSLEAAPGPKISFVIMGLTLTYQGI